MSDFDISSDSDAGDKEPNPSKLYTRPLKRQRPKRFFRHQNQAPCDPPADGRVLTIHASKNAAALWPQFKSVEPLRGEAAGTSWLEVTVHSPWLENLVRLKRPDLRESGQRSKKWQAVKLATLLIVQVES